MPIDLETANSVFEYDPLTGVIRNKVKRRSCLPGQVVGSKDGKGYLTVFISGKRIFAHRLAWLIFYGSDPDGQIDHVNLDRSDNRICNLRAASNSENGMNRKTNSTNRSGVKGVYWSESKNKWVAVVKAKGVRVYEKTFTCLSEASSAVKVARQQIHGKFTRHD